MTKGMETEPARELRRARRSGRPDFVTTPTRVASTGHVIPPIRAETGRPRWRLEEDWTYHGDGYQITLPRGWDTDLASIPRPLHGWLTDFMLGVTGPLLHDFIYDHGGELPEGSCRPPRTFTRREADVLLVRLAALERVPRRRRLLGWAFSRALGWTHWGVPGSRIPGTG